MACKYVKKKACKNVSSEGLFQYLTFLMLGLFPSADIYLNNANEWSCQKRKLVGRFLLCCSSDLWKSNERASASNGSPGACEMGLVAPGCTWMIF